MKVRADGLIAGALLLLLLGSPAAAHSLRSFPADVAASSLRIVARPSWPWIAGGAVAAGGAHLLDDEVASEFRGRNRFEAVGEVGEVLGNIEVLAASDAGAYLVARSFGVERLEAASLEVGQALVLSNLVTFGAKQAVRRERPDGSDELSFPSGHASSAFATATVVDAAFGHRAGALAFGLAAWVAASRLAENKHFFSDVVAGAGLGIVCGRAVVLGDRAGRDDRRQRAAFHVGADRLTVSLRF